VNGLTMKGIVLISGGIDSPVAAYLMAQYDLIALHCDNYPYTEGTVQVAERVTARLEDVLKKKIPLFTVPHGEVLSEFLNVCGVDGRKYTCLLCKRMMFRIGERIAHVMGGDFLVTGESLGQVASQTLQNIYVTSRAVEIPIVRPVIGLDKLDIISIAETVGTYEISIEKASSCRAVPRYPATRAHLETVEALERRLSVEHFVSRAAETVEKVQ
jgi:thiamine biosynthesis protein ThiI